MDERTARAAELEQKLALLEVYSFLFFFFNVKGEKFIVIIVFSGGMCIFKSGVARHGNTCSAWSEKGF